MNNSNKKLAVIVIIIGCITLALEHPTTTGYHCPKLITAFVLLWLIISCVTAIFRWVGEKFRKPTTPWSQNEYNHYVRNPEPSRYQQVKYVEQNTQQLEDNNDPPNNPNP